MMLDCQQLPEALADLVGGEGTDVLEAAVDRHVRSCKPCAEARAGLDSTLARARSLEVPEPPDSYWSEFRVELRQRIAASAPPWYTRLFQPWRVAAVTAAATAIVFAVLTMRAPDQPISKLGGPPPEPIPVEVLADLEELALAMDPLATSGALTIAGDATWSYLETDLDVAWDIAIDDPFSFLDATTELSADETDQLLDELAREIAG